MRRPTAKEKKLDFAQVKSKTNRTPFSSLIKGTKFLTVNVAICFPPLVKSESQYVI